MVGVVSGSLNEYNRIEVSMSKAKNINKIKKIDFSETVNMYIDDTRHIPMSKFKELFKVLKKSLKEAK